MYKILLKHYKKYNGDRYSGINFENISVEGKNTFENRVPNGTINSDTWIENINLFCGIIKAAEEIATIQKKPKGRITTNDIQKLKAFENLSNDEIEERDRLEDLLSLTIDEEEKQVYRDRYEVNSELMKKNSLVNCEMDRKIANKKLVLNKKTLGKVALGGEDPIQGSEYKQNEKIINSYLNRDIGNRIEL